MVIALVLELIVFIYAMEVRLLVDKPAFDNPGLMIARMLGIIIFSLTWGLCPLIICLLVACEGYWSAFFVFRRLGIGPNRITLASVFAFITILAAVTMLATIKRH